MNSGSIDGSRNGIDRDRDRVSGQAYAFSSRYLAQNEYRDQDVVGTELHQVHESAGRYRDCRRIGLDHQIRDIGRELSRGLLPQAGCEARALMPRPALRAGALVDTAAPLQASAAATSDRPRSVHVHAAAR